MAHGPNAESQYTDVKKNWKGLPERAALFVWRHSVVTLNDASLA